MESYAKYADMPRVQTCLLIDEPPVVVFGRTFSELVFTVIGFLAFAYFGMIWTALVAGIVVGGIVPMLRTRFPRGFIVHFLWSVGVIYPEVQMFTASRSKHVMGP